MIDKHSNGRDPVSLRALVVGGTGGIGAAVARLLAEAGVSTVVHGRSAKRLDAALEALRSSGHAAEAIACDLSAGEPSPELVSAARGADILVVAYGPFVTKPLADTGLEDWRTVALGDLALPGYLSSTAAVAMAGRGFGRILLFGGTRTDAIRGFRMNAAYAAAKTGIGVLVKSLAAEFGPRGVSAAAICPGFVDTEYLDAGTRRTLEAASPRGRLIPVGDVAALAFQLLTGGMDLANGAVITADGGLHAL